MATAAQLRDSLRQASLRITAPRLAVLASLGRAASHKTADSIALLAAQRLGRLSTQAVYDNLRVLEQAGLVRRIEPAGSAALYELRVGDNHHHLICRGCGITHDLDCATGSAPCLKPSVAHGFLIDEAEVIFWGYCPACAAGSKKPRPTRAPVKKPKLFSVNK
ncbi:MAG: Fur family transcriptional regulator [Chthoniobacterales bacterium]